MPLSILNDAHEWDEPTRRHFLAHAAKTLLGVSVAPAAFSQLTQLASAQNRAGTAGKAKSVIYLFMNGAMSQLDTLDPKPGREVQGPTKAIQTSVPGVQLSEHLPKLAKRFNQVSIVRSLHTETGAHGPGRYLMRTSYKEIASTRHPAMGAWAQSVLGKRNPELPANVVVGASGRHPLSGFLPARFAPVPIGNAKSGLQNTKSPGYLSDQQFNKRMTLINSFDKSFRRRYKQNEVQAYSQLYDEAIKLLKSSELKAFDVNDEPEQARERYGESTLGLGCLLARRLVERGVRFVEVVSNGWDNHRDAFDTLPNKVGELDLALTTLLDDLRAKNLLSSTMIVLATEFGRTPKINQNNGRDHHPGAFSGLLAGGGIRGGQVIGASDEDARNVDKDPVTVADFNATIAKAMGLPVEKEFTSPAGRPFRIANEGEPLTQLF